MNEEQERETEEIRAIETQRSCPIPWDVYEWKFADCEMDLRQGDAENGPGILIRRVLSARGERQGNRESRKETRRGQCPSNGRLGLLLYPARPVES